MYEALDPGAPGAAAPGTPKFVSDLDTLIRARYPLVYLVSAEEQRLDGILQELAQAHGKALFSWSVTRGLRRLGAARTEPVLDAGRAPAEALNAIARLTEPSLVVLKDFHPFLQDPATVRALRELAQDLKATFTTVILLGPVLTLPVELEKEISVLDVPLPGFRELFQLLREIVAVVRQGNKARVDLNREQAEKLIRAALGLTLGEAENAFAKAIANDGVLDARDVQLVVDEKRQVIRKAGLVDFVEPAGDLSAVGGMAALKAWLETRRGGFGEPARRFGLSPPRGVLLLGPHGCGKSLCAQAIAGEWRLPLLRLDLTRLGGDQELRRALRQAESVAPVVLWVDDVDQRPTPRPLFGWLQEKSAPVFVVATTQRVEPLPPHLLRKGCFDETFFLDLPAHAERREIFAVHLRQRERDAAAFDLDALAAATAGFSGQEIGQAVTAALFAAFAGGTEVSQGHLLSAAAEALPLSAHMGDEIARLRDWAQRRARKAG